MVDYTQYICDNYYIILVITASCYIYSTLLLALTDAETKFNLSAEIIWYYLSLDIVTLVSNVNK